MLIEVYKTDLNNLLLIEVFDSINEFKVFLNEELYGEQEQLRKDGVLLKLGELKSSDEKAKCYIFGKPLGEVSFREKILEYYRGLDRVVLVNGKSLLYRERDKYDSIKTTKAMRVGSEED